MIELDPDPMDTCPFSEDWHDCTLAGYVAAIKRGDGALEWSYQSILMFLGLPTDELIQWRLSLIAALSTKLRTKFEVSQQAHLDQIARREQYKADKANKKRNAKNTQTIDPIAGNTTGEIKTSKKPKVVNKPTSGAKGAVRKYAQEQAKQNTNKLI